jgi:hypothetical protein
MGLLDTYTLQHTTFLSPIPEYVILSHHGGRRAHVRDRYKSSSVVQRILHESRKVLPKFKACVPWQEKMASTGYSSTACASRKPARRNCKRRPTQRCLIVERSAVLRAAHRPRTIGAHAGARATQCAVQERNQPRSVE